MENEKKIIKISKDLAPIVPDYIRNRNEDIEDIKNLLASGDFEAITRLGHNMKGSGVNYGFAEISDIGRDIEIFSKQKDSVKVRECLNKLVNFITNLEIQYE